MHLSSYEKMAAFVQGYLDADREITILDIGSRDVNGSYRPLFQKRRWHYTGADTAEGKNVDIVIKDPYRWKNIKSGTFDVVVSGQAFEHIRHFWITMLEVARILKREGVCCIIAPSGGFEHKYPLDCWRFYPDGMETLAAYAGLVPAEIYTQWDPPPYEDGSHVWKDTVLIARKPHSCRPFNIKLKLLLHRLINRL